MRRAFEISREATLLMIECRNLDINGVLTYDQIKDAIGKDVRECRWILSTARKNLWNENVYIETVPKVGIQRLDSADAARSQDRGARHIHSTARKYAKRGRVIDVLEIPADERAAHVARTTIFSVIDRATSTRSKDRILAAVRASDERELELKQALAALMP